MIESKLYYTMEAVVFTLLIVAIFFVLAMLIKVILKKDIRTPKSYFVVIIIGFVLHRGLINILHNSSEDTATKDNSNPLVTSISSGLDAEFIAPDEAELEKFPAQLEQAIQMLNAQDREELSQSIGFLSFSLMMNLIEKNPKQIEQLSEVGLQAKIFTKMYRFAQDNGKSMSLRKYIELAEVFKSKRPEWWEQYQAQGENP